jgi:hypothetical protein
MTNSSIKTKTFLKNMLNAHFSGTSSPPTKMRIGTGTTTATENDTSLTNQVTTDGVSTYDIALQAGYPIVDETELNAETSIILTTTMANGNLITECGEFNASTELQSHHVFDGESKSNTDIFVIVEKTKIRNR